MGCSVSFAPVDQLADELALDISMIPLASWSNAVVDERRDGRLKAGVVAAIGTAIIAPIVQVTVG